MSGALAPAIQELAGHVDLSTTAMHLTLESAIRLLGSWAERGDILETRKG